MNKEIDRYTSMLQSGIDSCDNTKIAAEFLLSKDSEYLSINRADVARLFYQILCSYARLFGDTAHVSANQETFKLFNHISGINTDKATQSEDSNLMTIWFLNELYQNFRGGQGYNAQLPISIVNDWIMGLDDIKYIFKIKDSNGEKYFPINRLILKVLQDEKFISIPKLTHYHIRIFQLAVELFEEREEQKILNDIKEKCNLQFLEYLDGTQEILDSKNYMNYQKNGVMIFYNESKKSILIRHEKKEYFQHSIDEVHREIQTEYNMDRNPIGFFVIVDGENIQLLSYRDTIIDNPTHILELIYGYGCYNIFFDKALLLKDHIIFPINPYSEQDKYIVDQYGTPHYKENIHKVFQGYNLSGVKSKGIDFVLIGLCINLLQKENVGIDALGINYDFDEGDWSQNQVIKNWVRACKDPYNALKYILTLWYNELEYVCKPTTLKEHFVDNQCLLPYKCDIGWIYTALNLPSYPTIYECIVEDMDDGNVSLCVNNNHTLAGKTEKREAINIDDIVFDNPISEDESEDFKELGTIHYLVYDQANNRWCGSIKDEEMYGYLTRIELINENCLPLALKKLVSDHAKDNIRDYMILHKKALLLHDVARHDYYDFNAIVIFRLIHNMIMYHINADNWESYYKIITQHQKVTFSSIDEDSVFHLNESGVLYVPKESESSDSSLSRIYHEYLKNNTCRSRYNLYSNNLDFNEKENKYYINGNVIKKIVFLYDNICLGKATIISLAAYFDVLSQLDDVKHERKACADRALMRYIADGKVVSINDIVAANQIREIEVHSYYGTPCGVKSIKEFLEKCGLEVNVSFYKELTKKTDMFFDELKQIWPDKWDKLDIFYMFIREFNQPKRNVFPDEMLLDPKKAICLFVQKKEL